MDQSVIILYLACAALCVMQLDAVTDQFFALTARVRGVLEQVDNVTLGRGVERPLFSPQYAPDSLVHVRLLGQTHPVHK